MSAQNTAATRLNDRELAVRSQLEVWEGQTGRLGELLHELTDEQLSAQVAPGRNSGVYILGHLAAVNDGLLPLLGFGEKRFPHLEEAFLEEPHHAGTPRLDPSEVRRVWGDLTSELRDNFVRLTADEWFEKHAAVSDDDFADEPLRGKINVLIDRTNHVRYHLGELALLKNTGGN